MQNFRLQLKTLFRFCLVGTGNTLVDFGVFFLLTTSGIPYLVSQVCSYTAGMLNSFILNRNWTFKVKKKTSIQEVIRFLFINITASAIAFVLLFIFEELVKYSLFESKLIATAGGMIVNFFGSKFWVFQDSQINSSRGVI